MEDREIYKGISELSGRFIKEPSEACALVLQAA
jgi:hypothetical protein